MTLFAAMGIAITSATSVIVYGAPIWGDPIVLGEGISAIARSSPSLMFTVVVATLAVNIAADVVSPSQRLRERVPEAHRL